MAACVCRGGEQVSLCKGCRVWDSFSAGCLQIACGVEAMHFQTIPCPNERSSGSTTWRR